MQIVGTTVLLLFCSNIFMTFAWYAHLRNLNGRSWLIAALLSWGLALFEYLFQVPANRIGYVQMTLPQLKVLQEVITLVVFAPFAVLYGAAAQARLPMGWIVPDRRRVFYFSQLDYEPLVWLSRKFIG